MLKLYKLLSLGIFMASSLTCYGDSKQSLRVLSWEGYVTEQDIEAVNKQLDEQGLNYEVEVIKPFAEGAQQMFDLIRAKKCDIAFLTLFFIKMENKQISKFLQPIDIHSPRLSHYKNLLPSLTHLNMGLNEQGIPLYIPWGGGSYGFYIDRNKVAQEDVPTSVSDLWLDKWKNQFSLNQSQHWYNVGLALMSMGKSPFYLYEMAQSNKLTKPEEDKIYSEIQLKLNDLYKNTGNFWKASTKFNEHLLIVSSWGPEITRENNKGADWQKIDFKEGQMVWLDTINFVSFLSDEKREAAEIFANYFIGEKVQSRISRELTMVAASSLVPPNKVLGDPEHVFKQHMFVPPFDSHSFKAMKRMAGKAKIKVDNK